MKTLFALFLTGAFSASAGAYTSQIDTGGLTDKQVAQIKAYAAQMQAQEESAPKEKVKQVAEWVEVGANIGKGLAGAAKEVGVAVNDFVTTPVGKMTAAVILWKFVGGPLIHFTGGLLLWFSGWAFTLWLARRLAPSEARGIGKDKVVTRTKLENEPAGWIALVFILFTVAGIVTMFTF